MSKSSLKAPAPFAPASSTPASSTPSHIPIKIKTGHKDNKVNKIDDSTPNEEKMKFSSSTAKDINKDVSKDISIPKEYQPLYSKKRYLFYVSPKKWVSDLNKFLFDDILPQAIIPNFLDLSPQDKVIQINNPKNLEILTKLTSPEVMDMWKMSFTSKRWDPNEDKNYEQLEYIGDSVMRLAFDTLVIEKHPQLKEAELTPLRIHYLSKAEQAKIATELKLHDFVRTPMSIDRSIQEDLLESLFGALYMIGNKVFKRGMGYGLTYNLLVSIFKTIKIDLQYVNSSYVTLIKNIYEQGGWAIQDEIAKYEGYEQNEVSKAWTVTLQYPPALAKYLKLNSSKGSKHDEYLIVETGFGKKLTKEKAYHLAYEKLRDEFKITTESAAKIAKERERNNPDLVSYYPDALNRAEIEGFKDIYFPKASSFGEDGYTQLVGIQTDDTKEVLATIERDPKHNEFESRAYLLQLYSKFGRQPRQR